MINDKWLPILSSLGILIFLLLIWFTASAGVSRLLANYALLNSDLTAANQSVSLAPTDPETRRVRAAVLYRLKRTKEAAAELEHAVALRPRDDYLWLELAMIRDELQDSQGALVAFDQSVELAPFYAHPRWQRGNFLLRQRRYDDAFADLRKAAASDPSFVPNLIDLAWSISGGDLMATEQRAQIASPEMRAAFAAFLAKKGKTKEAAEHLASAGHVSEAARRQVVRDLIAAESFEQAFRIWNHDQPDKKSVPVIQDGGFEGFVGFEETGFGWRIARTPQNAKLATDATNSHSGSKSLLIEFKGNSDSATPLISQLVPVEPLERYRINFAARTRDLVSGGLPLAVVSDASGQRKRLGESEPLLAKGDWQTYHFEFQTETSTKAVIFEIQRQSCSMSPCPIFGFLWLDSFSIEKL